MQTQHTFYPRLIAVAAALSIIWGCASNSVTGRKQLMLVSENEAISTGTAYYSQEMKAKDTGGTLNIDKNEVRRVRLIASKIIPAAISYRPDASNWNWKVNVIEDDKTVNAFCTAGGGIAFYSGLISQLKATDDEIAQVMGHEVAHALASHTRERMSVAMAGDFATQLLASTSVGAKVGAQNIDIMGALIWKLPNSRAGESEADRIGIELAAKAGYNPQASVQLWEKMAQLSGGKSGFNMLSTHPSNEARIDALKKLVPEMMRFYDSSKKMAIPTYPIEKLG